MYDKSGGKSNVYIFKIKQNDKIITKTYFVGFYDFIE